MKAIWDEVRRMHRMTFADGWASAMLGGRARAAWWADPHLRKGYLFGILILLPAAFYTIRSFPHERSFATFYFVMIPAALLSNLLWFAVAAWSRARA